MPYTQPTATQFKARFTDFSAVANATIDEFVDEANRFVDNTWLEGDYQKAIMFLAAHFMVREGIIGGGSASAVSPGPVTSRTLGKASKSWASSGSGSTSDSALRTTAYGERFLQLRRLNNPGVKAVTSDAQLRGIV